MPLRNQLTVRRIRRGFGMVEDEAPAAHGLDWFAPATLAPHEVQDTAL